MRRFDLEDLEWNAFHCCTSVLLLFYRHPKFLVTLVIEPTLHRLDWTHPTTLLCVEMSVDPNSIFHGPANKDKNNEKIKNHGELLVILRQMFTESLLSAVLFFSRDCQHKVLKY